MSTNILHYNKWWMKKKTQPDRLYMQQRALNTLQRFFCKILKREFGQRVLDLGSGDHTFVDVCVKNGIDAHGIDICHGVDFETDRLPFSDGFFDVVLMYAVIEHIQSPANILLEAKRVLRDKGALVVITPNFDLQHWWLCSRDFFNDPTHARPYNRFSIKTLMHMYDFNQLFVGLWTVGKSAVFWRLPETLAFYCGSLIPFTGKAKYIPQFLKGKSRSMLAVSEK